MSSQPSISGIVPALVTPFDAAEDLDLEALERVVERVIHAGVHGIFVVGGQGEFYALSGKEQREVIAVAVSAAADRVPVYAGATAITTRETIERARASEAAGANAVTLLPPFFIRPSERELAAHFEAVAAAISVPVILYNQPQRTGVALTTSLVSSLARVPGIIAIKDSSASLNQTMAYLDARPDGFTVLVGNDTQIAWALLAGADGAIASTANVAPELCVAIHRAVADRDVDAARVLQSRLSRLRSAFDLGTFPVVVKEALALVGEPVGPCRAPVAPLDAQARARLREILADIGCLPPAEAR